jgi:hypothetical protein
MKTPASRAYLVWCKRVRIIQALHVLALEPENSFASGKIGFRQVKDKHVNQRFTVG